MKRLSSHVAILSLVATVITAHQVRALPMPAPLPSGVSKLVYYSPGTMGRVAKKRGVWGRSPDGCYLSSPLSDTIGSAWRVTTVSSPYGTQASLTCTQADVSQPYHKRWQIREQRLIEVDYTSARRLCGGHYAPWECWVKFTQIK